MKGKYASLCQCLHSFSCWNAFNKPLSPLNPLKLRMLRPRTFSIRVFCVPFVSMSCSGVKIASLSNQICFTSAVKSQEIKTVKNILFAVKFVCTVGLKILDYTLICPQACLRSPPCVIVAYSQD